MSALPAVTAAAPAAARAPAPALGFEKAKCERQLADWVHCVSATTPYGKARIEELTSKLSDIAIQVRQAEAARRDAAPKPEAGSGSTRPSGPLGATVDVYA